MIQTFVFSDVFSGNITKSDTCQCVHVAYIGTVLVFRDF